MDLFSTLNYCENVISGGIPTAVGNLVRYGVLIIQIVVPVLLIIWGMLDFAKGIMGSDEDKIKAGQKKFIQRLIAAAIVFLIVTIVQLVIGVVGGLEGEGNNSQTAWSCAKELINGKK